MEESEASRAQQKTGQVRLPGVTGNTPAPTVVNNNGAALAPVSVKVKGDQGTLLSSRQAMLATTNFVYEGGDQRSPLAAALAYDEMQSMRSSNRRTTFANLWDVCLTVFLYCS